ncbi:hypothetical protein QNO21_08985 [Microbacterium sp. zg-Y818]|uniref:hypothetical protein n=1 Tax=unclassified Microbacterium TaxID=2609290 RepID=UPI00214C4CB2|nr:MULTISPECIES: hypothetical protein [unclassified Microbacterium]MCR2801439.1 hypothetical protein [Microbacterium sp. zg.Y818]WIM21259.1 hypothetical protein QNO21_08985 [Microbacterium sp. zg-Y818]
MVDLKLDFAELRSSARTAETVASSFARAESIAGAAAADTGHDRLGGKVREFGDKWDIARGKLEDNLQFIADYLRAVVDTFSDLDTDLAAALEPAQNAPDPAPQPAPGGPAPGAPAPGPAPTPSPSPGPSPTPSPSPGPSPTPSPSPGPSPTPAPSPTPGSGSAGGAGAGIIGFGPGSGGPRLEPIPNPQDYNDGRPVVGPATGGPVYKTLPAILDESEVPSWARHLVADDSTDGATR